MPAGSKSIDLGPMSLALGENPPADCLEQSAAFQSDVQKLNRLLKAGMAQHDSDSHENAQSLSQSLNLQNCHPKEMHAMTTLVEHMGGLSQVCQVNGRRTAQLTLRDSLLGDAKLTAFEEADRLIFEIGLGDEVNFNWLAGKLPWLVRYVGERLNRPLRVIAYATVRKEKYSVSCDWPEGTSA